MVGPSKRGRKTNKEITENLFEAYSIGNPSQIRNSIQGWERETNSYEEDIEGQEESMDFVNDPRIQNFP